MAEAKTETEWSHTASLLALIAETHRDPEKRKRPFQPAEFHPLHNRRRRTREMTDEEAEAALYALAGQPKPQPPGLWETIRKSQCPT